jgi:hypothetical protein
MAGRRRVVDSALVIVKLASGVPSVDASMVEPVGDGEATTTTTSYGVFEKYARRPSASRGKEGTEG